MYVAVVEVLVHFLYGTHPLAPLRMAASVVLGPEALYETPLALAALVGGLVHLGTSALLGLFYGLVNSRFSVATQTLPRRQIPMGLVYGALVWLVNIQLIAGYAYPWFLEGPQLRHFIVHMVCFGLPLALMFLAAERQVRHLRAAISHT